MRRVGWFIQGQASKQSKAERANVLELSVFGDFGYVLGAVWVHLFLSLEY